MKLYSGTTCLVTTKNNKVYILDVTYGYTLAMKKHILLPILVLLIVLMSVNVFGLSLISETGFSETGGFGYGGGRNFVYEYDSYFHVINGDKIHKYHTQNFGYGGMIQLDLSVSDLHFIDGTLYLTQGEYVKAYNPSNMEVIDQWTDPGISTTVLSFDVSDTNIVMSDAGSNNVFVVNKEHKTQISNFSHSVGEDIVRFFNDGEMVVVNKRTAPGGAGSNWFRKYETSTGLNTYSIPSHSSSTWTGTESAINRDGVMLFTYWYSGAYVTNRNFNQIKILSSNDGLEPNIYTEDGTARSGTAPYVSVDGKFFSNARRTEGSLYETAGVIMRSVNGQSLGTYSFRNSQHAWQEVRRTYISNDNSVLLVGTTNRVWMFYTGVAGPRVTLQPPILTDEQAGFLGNFQFTVANRQDAEGDIECRFEYIVEGETNFNSTTGVLFTYNDNVTLPKTDSFSISFQPDKNYEGRMICEYDTYSVSGLISYSNTIPFNTFPIPFDPLTNILNNFGLVMYMTFVIFLVIAVDSTNMSNPYAVFALVSVVVFAGILLNILPMITGIFTLIVSFAFLSWMMIGGAET